MVNDGGEREDSGVSLTLEAELLGHSVSFSLVQINHSYFGAGFTQSVSKGPADALAAACHVGHLTVQAHPVEDALPVHPVENYVVHYFILIRRETHTARDREALSRNSH